MDRASKPIKWLPLSFGITWHNAQSPRCVTGRFDMHSTYYPGQKKLRQPRIMTLTKQCSMCSTTRTQVGKARVQWLCVGNSSYLIERGILRSNSFLSTSWFSALSSFSGQGSTLHDWNFIKPFLYLRQDPLTWVFGHFWLFCTMIQKKWRGIFCENFIKKFKGKVCQICHRSCSLALCFFTKLHTKSAVSESSIALGRLNLTFLSLDYLYETWHTCSSCSFLQNVAS